MAKYSVLHAICGSEEIRYIGISIQDWFTENTVVYSALTESAGQQ